MERDGNRFGLVNSSSSAEIDRNIWSESVLFGGLVKIVINNNKICHMWYKTIIIKMPKKPSSTNQQKWVRNALIRNPTNQYTDRRVG